MSKAEVAQSVCRHLLVAGVMVTAISVGTAALAADSSGVDVQPGALMLENSPEPIMLTEKQMDEVTAAAGPLIYGAAVVGLRAFPPVYSALNRCAQTGFCAGAVAKSIYQNVRDSRNPTGGGGSW